MKYEVKFTTQFKKDLKKAKKQHKNLDKLFDVVSVLAEGGRLNDSCRDHELTGEYAVLMLYRTGTHSELF